MDGITVMGLLLVFMGALITRSVWKMGYVAGQQAALAVLRDLQAKLLLIEAGREQGGGA